MVPSSDHVMTEQLAWVQWWAFPLKSSHEDWKSLHPEIDLTLRIGASAPNKLMGIVPCLPPPPHHTVYRLALASTEQLDLALALIQNIVNLGTAHSLSEDHHLWCTRLSKALSPDILPTGDDPLQLLRAWVEPTIWQRIRLRFPCTRVLEIEKKAPLVENTHSRIATLWQAVVWRVTSMKNHDTVHDSHGQEFNDALPAQN